MLKISTISVRISYFRKIKKQNRYLIMNLLSFSVTSIFIIVEKQLIKHNILTHCLS